MGLIRGMARTAAVVGTATAVSGRVQRRQANKFAAQDQAAQEQAQQQAAPQEAAPPPPAAAEPSSDYLAQLQQLGELRESGVLTDAEFQVQKERILANA